MEMVDVKTQFLVISHALGRGPANFEHKNFESKACCFNDFGLLFGTVLATL